MSTEHKKTDQKSGTTREAIAEMAKKIDVRIAEYVESSRGASEINQALSMATAIIDLRKIMTTPECVALLRQLCGTSLGFKSDRPYFHPSDKSKNKDPYPDDVLVNCALEALLRGYRLTGNEWNIIAGNFYAAKAGLQRKVYAIPGCENLIMEFSVPVKGPGQDNRIHVTVNGKFTLKGTPLSMTRTFAVTVFDGSADAALGKAERKFLHALYCKATNTFDADADADDMQIEAAPPTSKTQTAAITGGKPTEQTTEEKPKELPEAQPGKAFDLFGSMNKADEAEYEKAQRLDEQKRQLDNVK